MPSRKAVARVGLWLSCGGLVILAAQHLLAVYEPRISIDNLVLLVGALSGYLIMALGIWLSVGYRGRGQSAESGATSLSASTGYASPISPSSDTVRRMTADFLAWCEEDLHEANPWNSFDQLVRELLIEQLGAVRVRCYQVLPGDQRLRGLSQIGSTGEGGSARSGILGHVATTGQEFFAADPACGDLLHQLASDSDEPWAWICPIRQSGCTAGLVAVGKLLPGTAFDCNRRRELAGLITTFWKHVACLEQLRIAEKTDKASGLLTRGDFFECATRALADSYAENEPVVVVVLALEGLRRLDDVGRWQDRDTLVENIGHLARRRIRTDDVIGRFSDERFALLLRRLDTSLGRLIATKVQSQAQERMSELEGVGDVLRARVGLAGSGFEKQPLEKLMASAFDAVESARRSNVAMMCDLEADGITNEGGKSRPPVSPACPTPQSVGGDARPQEQPGA